VAKPRKRAERLTRRDVMLLTITVVILMLVPVVPIARIAEGPGLLGYAACIKVLASIVRVAINRK
jgi:hypothetical protein